MPFDMTSRQEPNKCPRCGGNPIIRGDVVPFFHPRLRDMGEVVVTMKSLCPVCMPRSSCPVCAGTAVASISYREQCPKSFLDSIWSSTKVLCPLSLDVSSDPDYVWQLMRAFQYALRNGHY